jgi:hypothetical protein
MHWYGVFENISLHRYIGMHRFAGLGSEVGDAGFASHDDRALSMCGSAISLKVF